MILMCADSKVYNVTSEEVYSANLLPGLMMKNPCSHSFDSWLRTRYSSNSNTIARSLKGLTFGQGKRKVIDRKTYSLSLSDSYWLRDEECDLSFRQISPYYADFWKGKGYYDTTVGGSIPTLYVGGYLPKEWVSARYLHKYGCLDVEVAVCDLCQRCGVPVCNIEKIQNGVRIENFTNPSIMLEQADQSGRLDIDNFDDNDIVGLFGVQGLQMLTVDAIVGNGDRHPGNFGWLRSVSTGEYLSMAPLYDFDLALCVKGTNDYLLEDLIKVCSVPKYRQEALRISSVVSEMETNEIFKKRAAYLLRELLKLGSWDGI